MPPGTMALSTRAEWAARLPFCLMGVMGIYAVYLCVSRFVSRRAGVIAAVVTATSPLYSLVSRQAMTDMAFVGPMTMALALGALALFDDEDATLERRELGLRVAGRTCRGRTTRSSTVAIGLFTLSALPQLVVNSIQLVWRLPVRARRRRSRASSSCCPYFAGFVAFLLLAARVRYKAPLYLFIAASLCGLATLAKGIAGLGLPVLVFLAYLGFTWNWKRLARAQLLYGVLVALLAGAVVAVPVAPGHARAARQAVLGRALRRQPLAPPRRGPPRRSRHVRVLPARARLRRRCPGSRSRPRPSRTRPCAPCATCAARASSGSARSGSSRPTRSSRCRSRSSTTTSCRRCPASRSRSAASSTTCSSAARRRPRSPPRVVGIPLLALVIVDLAAAPKDAQHFIWLFSYDYINSPAGRPWPPALDFGPALIGVRGRSSGPRPLALGVRRLQRAATVGRLRRRRRLHLLPRSTATCSR